MKSKRGKAEVEPDQSEYEPPPKRLHGDACKKRQNVLQSQLQEKFVESPRKTTDQAEVMDFLKTESKSLTTRAVKAAFPSVTYYKRKKQYRNMRKSISFQFSNETPDLEVSQNTEILRLQEEIFARRNKAKNIMDMITSNSDVQGSVYLRSVINMYNEEMESITQLTNCVDQIYERQLKILLQRNSDNTVSATETSVMISEYDKLSKLVDLGIRRGATSLEETINGEIFNNLKFNFIKDCPMLTSVIQSLFPESENSDRKPKCAIHALSLLASLRNRHCKNDITLIFTIFLVSYKMKRVSACTPQEMPLLLLMDNVNMYRGNKRHHRLFKAYGSNMWNFTVRGLLIPNLEGIEEFLMSKETACASQHDVTDFKLWDISLERNKEHNELWNKHLDCYFTNLLKDGLNISTDKPLGKMSEKECDRCLSTQSYSTSTEVKVSADYSYIDVSQSSRKTETIILPISLENNSTLAGTCAILEQFCKDFSIPTTEQSERLPFDRNSKTFSLKEAREHAEFVIMMHYHGQGRSEYHQELSSAEDEDLLTSGIGTSNVDNCDENDTVDTNVQMENDYAVETTVSSMQRIFNIEDRLFKSTYDSLKHKIDDAVKGNKLDRIVKEMMEKPLIKTMKHHLGRTFLHVAVEKLDINFVQCLLHAGFNPNAKEKCGATPLIIAIIGKSKEICQLLVNARASVRGPLFTNIPSPVSIASNMDLDEISDILQPTISDEEDTDLQLYDPIFSSSVSNINLPSTEKTSKTCKRSFPGFLTGVVGDIGTCKTNRGVMSRSASYQWVGIIPGDMHTKGYLAEACFKEQGCGGFHHMVQKVMKRPKLTREAFKKKKFAEGNLDRIKESVQDGARAYGLAAVMLFKNSELYPDTHMLLQCYRATGCHTQVLLQQFKMWIEQSSMACPSFKYRSRMFAYYGPLLELYNLATSHCWGQARETVFLHQLPTYAQLNFPNYYTECFIHVVNLLGK